MQFLTDNGEIDVDVHDLIMGIDTIFHNTITDKCGITVAHNRIQGFVVDVILENNERQRRFRQEEKEIEDNLEKFSNKYNKKLKNGKIVKDLKGIKNIIKYYIFNYILIYPTGCGTENHVTQCAECKFGYGSDKCEKNREINEFLLIYKYKVFV